MNNRNKTLYSALASVVLLAACSGNNISTAPAEPATATASGNVANEPVTAVASSSTNPDAAALVRIDEDTMLMDANGQPVADVSNVILTVEAYDGSAASEDEVSGTTEFTDQPIAEALADAFGKDLDTSEDIVINVAGFARVNVSAAGRSIKEFDPPITISIKTGLAQGRTVGVISIDENTGARLFEGTASVLNNGNVTVYTDHLTDIVVVADVEGTASGSGGSTQ